MFRQEVREDFKMKSCQVMEVCECCIYEFFEKHFCSDAHFLLLASMEGSRTRLGPFWGGKSW